MTGATPASYRFFACASRASKIDDGTPLYCAEPSTTIASDLGRESCRAFHQIASAVDVTSSRSARTAAPTTLPIRLPSRSPTGHGYHVGLTPCRPLGIRRDRTGPVGGDRGGGCRGPSRAAAEGVLHGPTGRHRCGPPAAHRPLLARRPRGWLRLRLRA